MAKDLAQIYEENQRFNAIASFLHGTRYRNLLEVAAGISPRDGERLHVLDIGCGPGKAFAVLNEHLPIQYTGVDVNQGFVRLAAERYGDQNNFEVIEADIQEHIAKLANYDLVMGLESFEHIPEPLVVKLVEAIGASDFQRLYVTVPNELGPALAIKNVGSFLMGYERWKEYSWRETFFASVYNLDRVGVHGVEHKGFDWRWLAQTLRQNVNITHTYGSPFAWMPRFISPSIGFVCAKRTQA
ncbi:MAG: class I SAM-dependent methyltransferase [Pseudomonadota bacterium]